MCLCDNIVYETLASVSKEYIDLKTSKEKQKIKLEVGIKQLFYFTFAFVTNTFFISQF